MTSFSPLSFGDRLRIQLFVLRVGLRLFLRIPIRREWVILRELRSNLTEAAQADSVSSAIRGLGRRRELIAGYIEGQRGHVDFAFGLVGALIALELFVATRLASASALGVGAASAGGWRDTVYHGSLFDVAAMLTDGKLEPAILAPTRYGSPQDVMAVITGFVVGSQMWRLAGLRKWISSLTVVALSIGTTAVLVSQLPMGNLSFHQLTSTRHDSDLGLAAQIPFSGGDFPSSWKQISVGSDGGPYVPRASMHVQQASPSAQEKSFDDCIGRDYETPQGEAAGYSGFDDEVGKVGVTTTSNLFANVNDAKAQVVPLQVSNYHDCLKSELTSLPGNDDSPITFLGPIPSLQLHDNEVGFRTVFAYEDGGVKHTKTVDVVTMYSGRMASQLTFNGWDEPVASDTENTYLDKFRSRTIGAAMMLDGRS
jgi:hypothetical protein